MKKIILLCLILVFPLNGIYTNTNVNPNAKQKWYKGIVFYTICSEFTISELHKIEWAMDEWEEASQYSVKFIQISKSNIFYKKSYKIIKIKKSLRRSKCIKFIDRVCSAHSTIAYNPHNMMVIYNCANKGMILHELGHCLGLYHEHQRPDRDNYITVVEKNIEKKYLSNFKIIGLNRYLYPPTKWKYDYNSIMHYSSYAFSKNCKKTILSKVKIKRNGLSEIDKKKIIYMYGKNKNY